MFSLRSSVVPRPSAVFLMRLFANSSNIMSVRAGSKSNTYAVSLRKRLPSFVSTQRFCARNAACIYDEGLVRLHSINTALHSGMVTPTVSCPTVNVIVLSCSAMAFFTLSYAFLVSSSSLILPSPAARITSYSQKTGSSFNNFAKAFALATRFKNHMVCFNSPLNSGVENGYFSLVVRACRNFLISSSCSNLPFSSVIKNSLRSKA